MRWIAIAVGALIVAAVGYWLFGGGSRGEIGAVSTNVRVLGPNDRIVIDAFADPDVDGVTCYLSRPERGGVKGALGVAEDIAHVSIACRQTAPIVIKGRLKDGERVFDERRSLVFKQLKVVRFFDAERKVLVYVGYTDAVITGAPQSSLSAVPLVAWDGVQPRMM